MKQSTISVCIPVFNEAENVALAVDTVEEIFHSELPQYLLELIITDNASTDRTWATRHRIVCYAPSSEGLSLFT